MSEMFSGCISLTTINLSNLNTQNVTNVSYMFSGCLSLTNVDLSNFNSKKVIFLHHMFRSCNSLKKNIITKDQRILRHVFNK